MITMVPVKDGSHMLLDHSNGRILTNVFSRLCKVIARDKDGKMYESTEFTIPEYKPSLAEILLKLGLPNLDNIIKGPVVTTNWLIKEGKEYTGCNVLEGELPSWMIRPQTYK